MKRMIKDLQDQKTTPNHSVVTEFLKKKMSYIRNENLTKTQIIETITENQYLLSTLATQSLSITKKPRNTRLEMANICTINSTKNNKFKPPG